VVAFTATRSGIAERTYPAELAGPLYSAASHPAESELEQLVRDLSVDQVVFAYSDTSHATVMHAASRQWPRALRSSCWGRVRR